MTEEQNVMGTIDDENAVIFEERKRILFFGLPWTFTKYTVTPSLLTSKRGFFNQIEDDCYMYKIQDVKLTSSLLERMFGLGTVVCYTGDITHPELSLVHVKKSKHIFSKSLRWQDLRDALSIPLISGQRDLI